MPGLVRGEEGALGGKDELANYDQLTIGEVMALAVKGGEEMRAKLLKKEEKGKKRKEVIGILRVNWNS